MAACSSCGKELSGEFAFCPFCGAAVGSPARPREQRKVVTVLFCDVTGSTELGETLDPEALRTLLARYFERMKAIVERHGGSVEKFIGDAVMAVFGVPVVHEDDALRALRAAAEMRDALPELDVRGRIGIATGEVVTGTEERLATGDAVNLAARLEQAAQPGEILIADVTLRLTRHAAEVEPVEPLALKGKSSPVVAHRLVGVHGPEAIARQAAAPMVGRTTELRRLRDAYDQAATDRSCQLFTILGPAGVGKSRLVAEFLASLGGAVVVRGRCLPYGEGITYWPVVEVVKQLPAVELDSAVARVVGDLVGEQQLVTSSTEIAWGFRRLLETVASALPLVCVFDDIHWGEATFLELLEHVADLSRDAPILLLCIARPDLLDRRPGWSGGKVNATTILLEPLGASDADRMIESLAHLDEGLRVRIRDAAEGNPLFVEQMVAYAAESGGGDVAVPPTIQALLAARLDQLDAGDRAVLERGAVEGRIFHRGAVEALAPEEPQVATRLTSLVRKELVRPDTTQLAGDDAFRFRHLLIRDATYDALPKATRADLHERFAEWLETHGTDLVELDEILGYHLEQAHAYRSQLGKAELALGRRASARLADAAARAHVRGDARASAQLFERAIDVLPHDDSSRLKLLPALGRALTEAGAWARARSVLTEAVELGASADEEVAADATVALAYLELHIEADSSHAKVRERLRPALDVFERTGDDAGLARALALDGMLLVFAGANAEAVVALERAAGHARKAGDRAQVTLCQQYILTAMVTGETLVRDVLAFCETVEQADDVAPSLGLTVMVTRAHCAAAEGRHDDAMRLIGEAESLVADRGLFRAVGVRRVTGEAQLLAGDPASAEATLGALCDTLEAIDDWGHFASVVPPFADALWNQGRGEEAMPRIELARRHMIEDDADAQVGVTRVRARVLALRGEMEEAVGEARRAVERASRTAFLELHARALVDLGTVYELAGDPDAAVHAFEEACALFERKGYVVGAARARDRVAALRTPAMPS
jgi:class 3 adenylate cyclase/tetratricopeptide (TPR) repeat protein